MRSAAAAARPILFLSDYGYADEFVGICHAVIAREAPAARVVDLTHAIPPQDVLRGALALAAAAPYAPDDAVFLAVVDPGVGTMRRAVAVGAGRVHLVGPDNGLLSLAVDTLGGASAVIELSTGGAPSATFHGRDVFAPAAARLAAGMPLDRLGAPVDPAGLIPLELPAPEIRAGLLTSEVLTIDRFGNAQLAARPEDLTRAELVTAPVLELRVGMRSVPLVRARTFADVGPDEHGLLTDSAGRLAIVRNGGSAAESLGIALGDAVVLASPVFG